MKNKTPYYIDIFAGCGGMSSGLKKAKWKGLFAIEKDKMAFETFKHNLIDSGHFEWPKWLPKKEHEINKILKEYKKELISLNGKVDLVVGGPPCQGFSTAGRRNDGDKRNGLVDSYIKFIELIKPRFLFFENVYGFTTMNKKNKTKEEAYSGYVLKKLRSLGYDVTAEILDFSKFGIPQKRRRFILVGVLNGESKFFFELLKSNSKKFLSDRGLSLPVTLKDAISDLERVNGEISSVETPKFKMGIYSKPKSNYQRLLRDGLLKKIPDSHRFANHSKKTSDKFSTILKIAKKNVRIDKNIKKMFNTRKQSTIPLSDKEPSRTLTTLPDDYIHYKEPRILTVREYARIQSFSDTFEFKGNYTTGGDRRTKEAPRYTQIGNAIPPLFGEQAGKVFLEMYKK